MSDLIIIRWAGCIPFPPIKKNITNNSIKWSSQIIRKNEIALIRGDRINKYNGVLIYQFLCANKKNCFIMSNDGKPKSKPMFKKKAVHKLHTRK